MWERVKWVCGGFRKAVVGSRQRLKMGKMYSCNDYTLTHPHLSLVGREEGGGVQ